jgi:hypothetical protein
MWTALAKSLWGRDGVGDIRTRCMPLTVTLSQGERRSIGGFEGPRPLSSVASKTPACVKN